MIDDIIAFLNLLEAQRMVWRQQVRPIDHLLGPAQSICAPALMPLDKVLVHNLATNDVDVSFHDCAIMRR
jgi:hypothetical protein